MLLKISKKLWYSTLCSIDGLVYAFKHEFAFKLEVFIAIILSPLAFYIATDLTQLLLLLCSLHAVLVVELINTAVEAAVDRVGLERHDLSKYAKDAASAAVFWSVLMMVLVWGVILWSNLYNAI